MSAAELEGPRAQSAKGSEVPGRSVAARRAEQLRRRRAALEGGRRSRPGNARGRLEELLDEGSFVELDEFAAPRAADLGPDDLDLPGEGAITGFGTVEGRDVAVYATDPAWLAGSLGEATAEKIVKVQELALRNRIPLLGIYESMGARAQEGVAALAGCAALLSRSARAAGVVPQIAVVAGPCAGAAAHAAGLADLVFLVSGRGRLLSGPSEAARAIEAGGKGAEDGTRSRLVHFVAEDEAACWAKVRNLLSYLPSSAGEPPPFRATGDDPDRTDPALHDLMPDGHDYDVREIVARLLDEGRLLEVQPGFAPNLLTGLGRLGGHVVGVVANQPRVLDGALDGDACAKGAGFVRFCDTFNIPLLTLADTPGYAPGEDPDRMVREAAGLLHAYAVATVPRLTLVTGRLYGESYAAMSPRQMGADLSLAWPSAEIAIRPEEAVEILSRRELDSAPDPAQRRAELAAEYAARFANPDAAAERGYVDVVIEPRETRRELTRALGLCLRRRVGSAARRQGKVPR